jgi:threonine/homoserine/homoserine lactone efflux protein
MIRFLTIGIALGLSAGLAPGPLLTLVISETLRHDIKTGIKVALAPILTDLPIIILTVFVLSELSSFHRLLGIISFAGGLFLLSIGFQNIRTKGFSFELKETLNKPLSKGVLTNALSPHPYLFWLSIGAPMVTRAWSQGIGTSLAFIAGFYGFLVGSKILLAILVGRSKTLLTSNGYIYTMRSLGVVLWALAIVLFHDALTLLEIL